MENGYFSTALYFGTSYQPVGKVFIFGGGAESGEVITESEMKVEPMERMIQPPELFSPFFLFNS